MAYEWQSDIIRPDGENGTEVLDTNGVYQPQIEGGDNITIENGRINASGTLENVNADWSETDPTDPSYIEHKPDLSIYATASGMETALAGKQDEISDLATIRSGAEAGATAVQPGDLAQVATTGSYTSLSNTPQNIVQDASYVHTDNNFSNADKSKLDGIAAGAEVNVQADWDEADSSSDAFIKNKPTIPAAQINSDWNAVSGVAAILNKPDLSSYATDSELTDGLATKQDVISDLDTIRSGAAAGATAAQPSDLPSSDELVPSATSGDAGKVLTVDNQGNPGWVTPSAGTVYTPGDGIDITSDVISADVDGVTIGIDSTTKKIKSLQTIPTKTSDLQNDSNFVVASSLATVATSGSYADLSGKPTIPSVDQTYNASSTNAQSGTAVAGAVAGVKQVPASTSADENKVLTVNSSGNAVWSTPAGGSDVTTANGNFKLGGSVPVKVNYTGSQEYERGSLQLVNTFSDTSFGNYAIAVFEVVGSHSIDQATYRSATLTINESMDIVNANTSSLAITFLNSPTNWVNRGTIYRDSCTVTDGKLDAPQSLNFWSNSQYDTGSYIGVGIKVTNNQSETEKIAAVVQQLANGAVSISNWPSEQITVATIPNIPDVTSSDDGKVLKASYSGGQGSYAWGTDSDTTYTAGNMIAINANNSNAIGVSTTAGITDIQQVAALPANPVATVLYLIPET